MPASFSQNRLAGERRHAGTPLAAAEALGSGLPALLVAAERVAATVWQGVHGRRRVGQGEAFWQFRRYEAGEPINRIDWRRSAKSDHLYIRQTEWEAAQTVWLWSDASASMHYRSNAQLPSKADRAVLLALATGALLVRGGERVAALAPGAITGNGRYALERLAAAFTAGAEAGRDTSARDDHGSLPPALPLPRHSRVVLIGDFLSGIEAVRQRLAALARCGVRGHLIHIVDPAEEALPFAGRVLFEGLENDGSLLFGRVEAVADAYRATFARHRLLLRDLTRGIGWSYAMHHTDRPAEPSLLALYLALAAPIGR